MAPPPVPPRRLPSAWRSGVLASLAWMGAIGLGLPQAAGLPTLVLIPVALVAGALLGLTRVAWLIDAAAGLVLGVIVVVVFTPLLRPRVQALITTDPLPAHATDAIVVLSASVSRDSLLSPAGTDRLLHAVELLHQDVSTVVVTSRVRHASERDTASSDRDQARLLDLAPDSVRWEVVDSVASTRDEAVRVAALARQEGWRDVVVVTSPLHTRRACATIRMAGLSVTCVAAPSREVAIQSLATPGDRLAAFGPWLHEVAGWWWYGVRGWR